MLKWQKSQFSLKWQRLANLSNVFLFSFISLFLCCHCAFHFPISIEIPPQKLFFCEPVSTEARDGKGLLGHPVSLAAGEARRDQQRGEECFRVASGIFSSNYWHIQSKAQQLPVFSAKY